MTTDELLAKLPSHIGNHKEGDLYIMSNKGDDIQWLCLHNDGRDWMASYGDDGEVLCMNPLSEEPPYDNAMTYGSTPQEALQKLYDWCTDHGFVKK